MNIQSELERIDQINIPLSEDDRPSIPSDPLFVQAVIDEANKDPWKVALENWFSSTSTRDKLDRTYAMEADRAEV